MLQASPKLAVIWTNFGAYHLARIRALVPYFDVSAIQLASFERLYGWAEDPGDLAVNVHTLRQGEWERQHPVSLATDLWRKLSQIRPHVVLVPGYSSLPALASAVWGSVHMVKTILMTESNEDDHPRNRVLEFGKSLLVSSLYDSAIVGGSRAMRYALRLGVQANQIRTGYDVVDNDLFMHCVSAARSDASVKSPVAESRYFLYVGRLAPEKNISTLLSAFAQYRSDGGTWKLVLVGNGPLQRELSALVGNQPWAGEVVFAGFKNSKELLQYYATASCFVLPSVREPWGLVVNEAMASGLPILVSKRCGCCEDLVDEGSNGFSFDPHSARELSTLLGRIASMPTHDRERFGRRSQEIVSRYSPETWARAVRELVAT